MNEPAKGRKGITKKIYFLFPLKFSRPGGKFLSSIVVNLAVHPTDSWTVLQPGNLPVEA